jgi:hypothetical protein
VKLQDGRLRLTGIQRLIFFALAATGAAFADDMSWVSAGNNVWSIFYVSPYTALDSTTGQNLMLFCIDYNHEISPPNAWQASVTPLTTTNLSQYQFGGTYTNVLPAGSTAASSYAFQSNTAISNGSTVTANLSTSGAMDRYLELAWIVTQMETALTDGQSNKMTTAAMDTALDVYQVADWLIFADNGPSEFTSGQTNLSDLENRIGATGGGFAFNAALGLWSASNTGFNFQYAIDSVLNAAENAVVNQGWTSSQFSVVTASQAWETADNHGVAVQEFLALSPVPEPSQLILLFTVFSLVGLLAWRSAGRKRASQVR